MRDEAYATTANLGPKTEAWLARVRAAVRPRPHLRIRPGACGLLVVDMLAYFASPAQRCYLEASAAIVPRIGALLEHWRAGGWPIAFTLHGHRGDDDLGMLGRFFDDYIRAGTPEGGIIEALAPRPGELCIPKTTYDAFLHTNLETELRSRGVEQLLITGVLTHMCCETSARAAFCRGFEVFVAADATATTSEERHLHSLLSMAESVAVILGSEEVLR